ncbi:MAG: hypothetical protein COW00_09420 [Bdellovibrio sp. CG12_big_fil_rev_8_21_14_0_65_39_13]|nr:MAG: hypothetical protein COW78_09495 [Bdellovibrio sp. CG22_combo_CG10-13_8_21_14_all_39_27]PIQ59840.1 MAG: hypothetical protein COW00_09420 [Bdellovibrio sp. CG12_big_fil_rev_8_21_14_0_65_39_13]PIR34520.1 MAG: hypothetical protein COV37_12735 [Bdellovibrio sp. CG11_big_fil_rev_8_21_14_0_20_39_38]
MRETYGLNKIVMAINEKAAHNILNTFSFDEEGDMIICNDISIEWFPDKNYYKLLWDQSGENIIGILKGNVG